MKITIIGSGAMGTLVGSMLASSGQDVMLIDIRQDQVDTINSKGLCIEADGNILTVDIKASTNILDGQNADLVIILVKSPQTRKAAAAARKCLNEKGRVLTLQNGMGNADMISQIIDPHKVIAGTTSHGATVLGPGLTRHAGSGPTTIGNWLPNNNKSLEKIKHCFCNAGMETRIEGNIHRVIWEKLIINIGINAITALTGIKNGKILDFPPTGDLVRAAVKEASDVALAHGVALPDNIVDSVFTAARATSPNRSSMGQDVDAKRPTEIDAINGAILCLAKEKDIQVPVNQTLTALINILQKNYISGEN